MKKEKIVAKKLKVINSKMVLIKADKKATHGALVDIMMIAKKFGASKITIATEQKKD
jgi:biopolymer transport protein ExbD